MALTIPKRLLDEELGDPPDFFSFAQKIALKAEGCARVDTLERATSEDSLGHLEPDDLADMFHPPVENSRAAFCIDSGNCQCC